MKKAALLGWCSVWLCMGCNSRREGTPFGEVDAPAPLPAKTHVSLSNQALTDPQPAALGHDTRFPHRYMVGVRAFDDTFSWRMTVRLAPEDLRHGVVRGTLTQSGDVGAEADTSPSRIAYVGLAEQRPEGTLLSEASSGSFELTLAPDRISGWVRADPVDGVDVSGTFEAELDVVCLVLENAPANPSGGSVSADGSSQQTRQREDRTLTAPGCERLRTFAGK